MFQECKSEMDFVIAIERDLKRLRMKTNFNRSIERSIFIKVFMKFKFILIKIENGNKCCV